VNGTQLVGVAVVATIYGKKVGGVIRWYRESHGTYGFQPDGASPTEELLVVGRDQLEFAHN
jgi:hypothetical protein